MLRLITIPISHYCEKARWALDRSGLAYREVRHVQVFHYLPARLAGGGGTVPVLVVDRRRTLSDSTEILKWVDERSPGSLYPVEARARREVLALEDRFDEDLGPATRRVVYQHILGRPDLLRYNCAGVPRFEAAAIELGFGLAGQFVRRRLGISPERTSADVDRIRAVFDDVAARLSDRRYLVGDTFTAADLTFACMAAPVLAPAEYGSPLPRADELPPPLRDLVEDFRRHPAGARALRLFREDRRPPLARDFLARRGRAIRFERITAATANEAIGIMNRAFAIWAEAGFKPHSVELAMSYLLPDGHAILGPEGRMIGTLCVREAKPSLEGEVITVSRAHKQDRARLRDVGQYRALTADRRFLYFYAFSIDPDLGRAGLGAAALTELETIAAQGGFHGLLLETGKSAGWLIAWYERLGFEIIAESDDDGRSPRTVMMLKRISVAGDASVRNNAPR